MKLVLLLASLASIAAAIDCSAKELDKYNFKSIKGSYSAELTKDTPPSKSVLKWSVGICQNLDDECPKNSDICGTTRVLVDDKDVLAEVIGFNSNLQKEYTPFSEDGESKESGITVSYKGQNWGDSLVDAHVRFVCPKSGEKEDTLNKLKLVKWDGNAFEGEFRTKAACISAEKKPEKKPTDDKHDKDETGESWGWFTWIFIFMVLFLSIYIIGGAWFQYNKGNLIDFLSALREVLENFVDLLRGLPAFVREIVEKFTGNSNRGEYSAV